MTNQERFEEHQRSIYTNPWLTRASWRKAIEHLAQKDDSGYWPHELKAFDKAMAEAVGWREWLLEHEWSASRFYHGDATPCCPECGKWKDEGHAKDCKIAAMLASAPTPEPMSAPTAEPTVDLPKIGVVPARFATHPGILALLQMVTSMQVIDKRACWDHMAMFEVRDQLVAALAIPPSAATPEPSDAEWKVGPLTDELVLILGRPNFTCIRYAEMLRELGQEIRRKSEFEQAAVIHWMLGFYATHGDKWAEAASESMNARFAAIRATKGGKL